MFEFEKEEYRNDRNLEGGPTPWHIEKLIAIVSQRQLVFEKRMAEIAATPADIPEHEMVRMMNIITDERRAVEAEIDALNIPPCCLSALMTFWGELRRRGMVTCHANL